METPAVILLDPKYPHNVGAAIRACSCFDVNSLIWTGERVNPAKYGRNGHDLSPLQSPPAQASPRPCSLWHKPEF